MQKVKIGKPIEGISLNGLEWLLDEERKEKIFNSKEEAINFLKENGYEDYSADDFEDEFVFEEI